MKTFLTLTLLLSLSLSVHGEAPVCPDQRTKDLLQQYKVSSDIKEIRTLLKGNTYVDIWRRKKTTNDIDCSVTVFTENLDTLITKMHNVQHDGKSLFFTDKWTENSGESSFNSYGEVQNPGEEKVIFDEYIHIFFVDQNVLGYFSCDVQDSFVRMAVSIRKDKQTDKKALDSLNQAVAVMNKLKEVMPDEMTQFARKQCPEK